MKLPRAEQNKQLALKAFDTLFNERSINIASFGGDLSSPAREFVRIRRYQASLR